MWLGNRKNADRACAVAIVFGSLISSYACAQADKYLFEKVSSAHSNVHFINKITDSVVAAAGKYIYVTNAAGTGVADLNGDGRPDIFFSNNIGENKLYLNEGNFKFRDVTHEAGVKGNGTWGTGVCIADINGDGLLDIYVSHSGKFTDVLDLCNEAYICTGVDANKIPHFINKAKEYRLDAPGSQTSQAAFFDYDKDGDLDCFLLNHSNNANGERLVRANFQPDTSSPFIGYNQLFRNDPGQGGPSFTDVSQSAGIINSKRNFGLGIVVSDFNNDNWPDIYCTSDFAEREHMYINNRNGTFRETADFSLKHMSQYSMGVDAADINNDLLPDIMSLDMLPDENYPLKLQLHPDNTDQFEMMVKMGLSRQYPKNTLQLNIGSDNGVPLFTDIAQLAGVSNTNWSWSPLFIDFNNDRWKDIFVSNGFFKDYTDQDVQNKFLATGREKEKGKYGDKRLNSCLFLNNGTLVFNCIDKWKQSDLKMSYSACAADFDNDGKVDLLINNLNDEVSLLKNVIDAAGNGYLNIKLRQKDKNTLAIGAKVYVSCGGTTQMQEMQNIRGYQSSQDYVLHFGLGSAADPIKVKVVWPDGTQTEKTVMPNTNVTIDNGGKTAASVLAETKSNFSFTVAGDFCNEEVGHTENKYNDFKTQFTLPYRQSAKGPGVAEGDINGDGINDYYIGGSTENERYFLLGQKNGKYIKYKPAPFSNEKFNEDVAAAFFDADGDKDLDLVVISGGVEYPESEEFFTDRLYRNDGKGNFEKMEGALPRAAVSKGAVAVGDYDNDGKSDLFIGGYTTAGKFEQIPRSFLLKNVSANGVVKFTDVTESVLPAHGILGMVTSASFQDINGDQYPELMICGEWMPFKVLMNNKGILAEQSSAPGDELSGLYDIMHATDYDGDGKTDLMVGNAGNNNQFKASAEQPMKIFAIKDSVNNISSGFLFSYYIKGVEAVASSRVELLQEFVPYKKVFPNFMSYASVDVKGFFEKVNLPMPQPVMKCTNLLSGVYLSRGDYFKFEPLPDLLQTSVVRAISELDWNFDGRRDYIICGNFHGYKHQFGPADGMPAYILENQGAGKYRMVKPEESGLFVSGQVKKILVSQGADKCRLLFVRNNDKIVAYENKK
jgi:hypothetical protein